MQLRLLVTSPRVAPGLMTWAAWQAVSSAERVLASDAETPVVRAVLATGHQVEVLPDASASLLLDEVRAGRGDLVWLASDEEAASLAGELAGLLVRAGEQGAELPEVEVLHASYDVPGARLLDLVTVMDRLRTECPWDREQTHRSLGRHLLEESHETLEAIESGDREHLREELGDLLLQVLFHARIAEEDAEDPFTVDDVAGGIVEKLVRRHPHVFAGLDVADADEVEVNWERLKAEEKGRGSVLEGIPATLPALSLAEKVVGRAARMGISPVFTQAPDLGEQLLRLVLSARAAGADAEQELREAVRRLADQVRSAE